MTAAFSSERNKVNERYRRRYAMARINLPDEHRFLHSKLPVNVDVDVDSSGTESILAVRFERYTPTNSRQNYKCRGRAEILIYRGSPFLPRPSQEI